MTGPAGRVCNCTGSGPLRVIYLFNAQAASVARGLGFLLGWARRAQAQKNNLIVDRQPGTCYGWEYMGLEIIIINLILIYTLI